MPVFFTTDKQQQIRLTTGKVSRFDSRLKD